MPITPVTLCSVEPSFSTCPASAAHAEGEQQAQHEHDGGVAEREPEADATAAACPRAISLRVVLSMAAMWSASNACRMPSVYAVTPSPMPKTCGRPTW